MKKILLLGFISFIFFNTYVCQAATNSLLDSDLGRNDSSVVKRKPLVAVGEIVSINMIVWGFNYFIMDEPFAQINIHTMKTNLQTFPVWDTDKFATNLVAHPYHGSLYFNAARSNGISFWESIPYTFGGSLMWEFFMENELPSCNDLIATTFGGVILGEMTYRLSDMIFDNRKVGFPRVLSEVAGGLISPVRGVNRVLTGQAWKYSSHKGNSFANESIDFSFSVGPRYLTEQKNSKNGEISTSLGLSFIYGDLFSDDTFGPYDYFRLYSSFDFFSSQPICTQVNALGMIWGKNIWKSNNRSITSGIFQHFNYYDSQVRTKEGKLVAPYRIAEAASVGGGFIYRNKPLSPKSFDISSELYINGVPLGASLTDYFFVDERDYNLGSGYSLKSYTKLKYKDTWEFMMNMENYHIFTWKGYDPDINLAEVDYTRLNVQGDKGNTRLSVFNLKFAFHSNQKWSINLSNSYYSRYTNYKYHPNVQFATSDLMLNWSIKI